MESITPDKKRSHPTCSDRLMIQEAFDQSRIKIRKKINILLIESSLKIKTNMNMILDLTSFHIQSHIWDAERSQDRIEGTRSRVSGLDLETFSRSYSGRLK